MIMSKKEYDNTIDSSIESILLYNIPEILTIYEKRIFESLTKNNFKETEKHLFDLSFDILDMPDEDQTFLLRIYFTSIVTEIIRPNARSNRLHPEILAYSKIIITTIESWENVTEFILSISWFVDNLKNNLIKNTVFFIGNSHIETALSLISLNIENKYLSLNWLAEQIGVSTTHLSNLFKLHMGETITIYIKNKRMDRIIFDMKYTNESLYKIRLKYGFKNQSHFIQYFKKAKGKTPLAFKKTY
ncbi:MAG TPA: helix-turn-helix transcriptional regulator [Pseudogracilibacillus sp.]|nr:helix-turn-helix transcriptional regulator [Pseudogracilibacillus sp.]